MVAAAGPHGHTFLAATSTPDATQVADAQEDDHSARPPRSPWRILAALGTALVASAGLAAVTWSHNHSGTSSVSMTSSASSSSGTANTISLVAPPKFAGAFMSCSRSLPCWAGCLCAPSKKDPDKHVCQPVDGVKDCKYGVKAAYHHLDKANKALAAIKAKTGKLSNRKASTEKIWEAAKKVKFETGKKAKQLHEKYTKLAKTSSFEAIKKEHEAKVAKAEAALKAKLGHLHTVEHGVMNKAAGEIKDAEKQIVHLREVVTQTNTSELKKEKVEVGNAQKIVKASEGHEWKVEHLKLAPIIQAKKTLWKAAFTKAHAANDRSTKATQTLIDADDHRYKMSKDYEEAAKRLEKEDVKVNKWLDALNV